MSGKIAEMSGIENSFSSLKKEFERLVEKNKSFENEKAISEDLVKNLVLSYDNKIRELQRELKEAKEKLKESLADFDNKIKDKDEEIKKIILFSDDSPKIAKELRSIGISEEIIALKKVDLCKSLDSHMKKNFEMEDSLKKLEFGNKKLKEEFAVVKASFSKNFDDVSQNLKDLKIEKEILANKCSNLELENNDLKNKALDVIKAYDKKLDELKLENEKKEKDMSLSFSRSEINYKTQIAVLEKRIEEYKEVIFDSQKRRDAILKAVEEKVSKSIAPIIARSIISNDDSVSMNHLIRNMLDDGADFKNVVSSLENRGFEREEIVSEIKKIEKKRN